MALRRTAWLAGLFLVVSCSADQSQGLQPTDEGTPLASFATDALSVARSDFCDEITDAAVARALGGPTASTAHYGSGELVEISPGITDIAHEFRCSFSSAEGVVASSWVFAPPITRQRANRLVMAARQTPGCRQIAGAPQFGTPTLALECNSDSGDTSVAFYGLFIDAWLSCSLSAPVGGNSALGERADLWCSAVASAANQASSS